MCLPADSLWVLFNHFHGHTINLELISRHANLPKKYIFRNKFQNKTWTFLPGLIRWLKCYPGKVVQWKLQGVEREQPHPSIPSLKFGNTTQSFQRVHQHTLDTRTHTHIRYTHRCEKGTMLSLYLSGEKPKLNLLKIFIMLIVFFYLPSSGISSCVRIDWAVTCLHTWPSPALGRAIY